VRPRALQDSRLVQYTDVPRQAVSKEVSYLRDARSLAIRVFPETRRKEQLLTPAIRSGVRESHTDGVFRHPTFSAILTISNHIRHQRSIACLFDTYDPDHPMVFRSAVSRNAGQRSTVLKRHKVSLGCVPAAVPAVIARSPANVPSIFCSTFRFNLHTEPTYAR